MSRPPCPSPLPCPPPARDGPLGLAVRDGLREMRFNLRRGADQLAHEVQVHPPGLLGPLGEPLGAAARTTATLLRTADRVASTLLHAGDPFRAMQVPLQPAAAYLAGDAAGDPRLFGCDHYWRLRHWFALQRRPEVFVREQRCEQAGRQAVAAVAATVRPSGIDRGPWCGAHAARALCAAEPLAVPSGGDAPALAREAALAVVLAGEIAGHCGGDDLPARTRQALEVAHEIVVAERASWEQAMHADASVAALADWLAFVDRHL